jgi:hypothetical protein
MVHFTPPTTRSFHPLITVSDILLFKSSLRYIIPYAFILFVIDASLIKLHGQIVFTDTGEESPTAEIRELLQKADSTLRLKTNGAKPGRADIMEINDQKFLLPDGYFDVYLWQNREWVNLYKGRHFGYNNQSRKYIIDGKIYSLGGKGFWTEHGHLIIFDQKINEWELLPSTKELPPGFSFLSPNDHNLQLITAKGEWKIKLPNGRVSDKFPLHKALQNLNNSLFIDLSCFETDSLLLICGGKPTILIHKNSYQVFINDILLDKTMRAMQMGDYVYIRGNDFRVINPLDLSEDTLTQDRIYEFFNIAPNAFLSPSNTNKSSAWIWLPALFTIAFSAFLIYRKSKKKNSFESTPIAKIENPVLFAFINLKGQTITADQLDIILDLHNITSNETQRFRRAHLIKQINKEVENNHGQALIIRIPDPEDGRRYLYKINDINTADTLIEARS